MKIYKNHRQEPYFTYLKNGQKTIEGRIRKGKYAEIKVGDHIMVNNTEETEVVKTEVIDTRNYHSIKEMLEKEEIKKLLPDAETVDEGIKIYSKFYNLDQEKEYGLVAIEVKLI
jgi:ASC-1-like (ASCH) protein